MPNNTLQVEFIATGVNAQITAFRRIGQASAQAAVAAKMQMQAVRLAQGPYQRLQTLQRLQVAAFRSGNVAMQKDLAQSIQKTQRQIRGAGGRSFGKKLIDAIGTTRIGSDGSIAPLVNRIVSLVGPEVAAVSGATAALIALTNAASDNVASMRALKTATGTSSGTAGVLSQLAGAGGVNSGQMATLANAFQTAITTNPMAQSMAAQMGIHNMPGIYGNLDYGKQYIDFIDKYRKADPKTRQKLNFAIGDSAQAIAPYVDLSDTTYAQLKKSGAIAGGIDDDAARKAQAEGQAALAMVGQAGQNFGIALFTKNSTVIIGFLKDLASGVNSAAVAINKAKGVLPTVKSDVDKLVAMHRAWEHPSAGSPSFASASPHAVAMFEHSKALKEHTQALKASAKTIDAMPGVYGHDMSGRQASAIPSAFGFGNGAALHMQRQSGGLALGVDIA